MAELCVVFGRSLLAPAWLGQNATASFMCQAHRVPPVAKRDCRGQCRQSRPDFLRAGERRVRTALPGTKEGHTMDSTVHSHSTSSVYETITDSIILAIDQGASDFVMPWHGGGGAVGKPTNALTGATYRGINVVALWAEAWVRGYGSGHWATYRQWATLGAQVRRGEQASTIVFYKKLEASEPEEGEDVNGRLVARAARESNSEDMKGWARGIRLRRA